MLTAQVPLLYVFVATNAVIPNRAVRIEILFYDQHRLLQVIALLVVACLTIVYRVELSATWQLLPRLSRWSLAGVITLGSASAVRATFPGAALREVGLFVLLGLLAIYVATERRRSGATFDRLALTIILLTAVAYVASFLLLEWLDAVGRSGDRGSAMWGFGNPRVFGQVALWIFPLLVSAVVELDRSLRYRILAGSTAALWAALMIESGSRSALLGTAVGLGLIAVTRFREARTWLLAASAICAGSAVSWAILFQTSSDGGSDGGSSVDRLIEFGSNDSGRLVMWSDAWEMGRSNPILGIGPEHYAHTPGTLFGSPHSAPLQLLAEWGVPATLIVLTLAWWGITSWLARGRSRPSAYGSLEAGLGAALVAAAVASLLDGIIVTPISQTMLAVVSGWMLGRYYHDRNEPRGTPKWGVIVLPGVALAATAALVAGALPYARSPASGVTAYREASTGGPLPPRFWVVGRLAPADWDRLVFQPLLPGG